MNLVAYNHLNIFARILRGELPAVKHYENKYVMVVEDLYPSAPIHLLFIPKGPFVDIDMLCRHATDDMIIGVFRAIPEFVVASKNSIFHGKVHTDIIKNYIIGINTVNASYSKQEIMHVHLHLIAGTELSTPNLIINSTNNVYHDGDVYGAHQNNNMYIYTKSKFNTHDFLAQASDKELLSFVRAIPNAVRASGMRIDAINIRLNSWWSNAIWEIRG